MLLGYLKFGRNIYIAAETLLVTIFKAADALVLF